jgi:hypothetical protein
MSRLTYNVGDMIVLRSGLTRMAKADRKCEIVSILPDDNGHAQYRVRLATESFERRITEDDIDPTESASPAFRETKAQNGKASPWLKPSSIKIGK